MLTRKETAKLFGVSLVTFHEWVKAGKVKSFRIGKAVRFKEEDVMAALQEQKFGTLPKSINL
ncbi:MAG: helix-turn-helix domain-containing protein [Taibaiella sp.]|nr:helix-turn-helix domain-containing protein [Taibaiella sp.]